MKKSKIDQLSSWLATSGDYVSGNELAALLHTTTRTVRNYVLEINAEAKGEPLILTSRKGYRWNFPEERVQSLTDQKNTAPQDPSERASYIIRQLLYRKNIQYDNLMEKLSISSHTLDADLINIKGLLRPFRLNVHRRGNLLYLKGQQMDRRHLIVSTILKTCHIVTLSLDFLAAAFPDISVADMDLLLQNTLANHKVTCFGEAYYELLLYIVVQVEQIRADNVLTVREYILPELENYPDYPCAIELTHTLENIGGVNYPQTEIEYLTLLLIAKADCSHPADNEIPTAAKMLLPSASILLTRLSRYLHTDFSEDSFTAWIAMYLQRMIVRQDIHLVRPSQMRSKMKCTYPSLYELVANFLFQLSFENDLAISSDEICQLSILLASRIKDSYVFEAPIICSLILPVDPSLAKQIQSVLSARIGSVLNIQQVLLQADEEQLSKQTQLVLSLVPLQHCARWIQISPFPKSADYRRIYTEILQIKRESYIRKLQAYFHTYLSDATFLHSRELKSKTDVIHTVCRQLEMQGIITEDYEAQLLKYEAFEPSGFENLVAVPFNAHPDVRCNCVFIVTTEKHILWDTDKINLFFFLICKDPDDTDFRDFYDLLVKVFSHPKNVHTIAGSRTAAEFLEHLESLFQ